MVWRTAVEVQEYERGLLYENGRYTKLLDPGRYIFWWWNHQHINKVDIRETSQTVQGQEILTSDKIPVKISLVVQYKISDPVKAVHHVESYTDQLYQDLQLTLREIVTKHTIEEVLEDRETLSTHLFEEVAPRSEKYGMSIGRVGVKDIILPGVVREVFLKEVEADRRGRAELVSARHETAAARSRANTAKLLAENPNILRLQELDTLASLASKAGNVLIIPGLTTMLNGRSENKE